MNLGVTTETVHPVVAEFYCYIIADCRTPIMEIPTRVNNHPHPLIETHESTV